MIITVENQTGLTVNVEMNSQVITLQPTRSQAFDISENDITLTVNPVLRSEIVYAVAKFGVILKRFFCVKAEYSFYCDKDCCIALLTQKKKGRFMDEYQRIVPFLSGVNFSAVKYSVADEQRIKGEIEDSIKKGDKALKIFDAFDILGNAFTVLLVLLVPFVLIGLFASFTLALNICAALFIPIFAVIVLINRYFDKVKRKAWQKAKGYTLKKEIFKDYNSYFDHEYIKSVFEKK